MNFSTCCHVVPVPSCPLIENCGDAAHLLSDEPLTCRDPEAEAFAEWVECNRQVDHFEFSTPPELPDTCSARHWWCDSARDGNSFKVCVPGDIAYTGVYLRCRPV